jgi:hypothetical protein
MEGTMTTKNMFTMILGILRLVNLFLHFFPSISEATEIKEDRLQDLLSELNQRVTSGYTFSIFLATTTTLNASEMVIGSPNNFEIFEIASDHFCALRIPPDDTLPRGTTVTVCIPYNSIAGIAFLPD